MDSGPDPSEQELLSKLHESIRQYRRLLFLQLELSRNGTVPGPKHPFHKSEEPLKDANREVEGCFNLYAQASCKRLCNMLQKRLPRELRDMIYRHISTRDNIVIRNGKPPQERAHYWDASFVGVATQRELVANYYSTSPVTILPLLPGSAPRYDGIHEPLANDPRVPGLQPLTFISEVTYVFTPGTLQRASKVNTAPLKSLLSLKTGAKITLVLTAWVPTPHSWLLHGGMDTFRDIVLSYHALAAKFKKSGYKVTVSLAKWPLNGTQATVLFQPDEDFSWESWKQKAEMVTLDHLQGR
ncbi:uncharacterized protein EI97DRAFT_438977 [Westerdykella ornata]|uniref:Uncharacterized protein n=1 Tax=Westerdykella ornata TaxID=318751 RepID=A0A6A6JUU9_WESOR|nr:uncharacterized protein EI97DRAFT_438977 [Westerdykella ornata]KAF2279873.1 hypothetical protein EI97DRAFT_438977 [Westerdykella ornata]